MWVAEAWLEGVMVRTVESAFLAGRRHVLHPECRMRAIPFCASACWAFERRRLPTRPAPLDFDLMAATYRPR